MMNERFGGFLPERARKGFRNFKKIMRSVKREKYEENPDKALAAIIDNGYSDYALMHFDNAKDRIDDLGELVNFAHSYKNIRDHVPRL